MSGDLFTRARVRITFLYLLLGLVIVGITAYFLYSDITAIILNTLKDLQTLIAQGSSVNQGVTAQAITESINAQLAQTDIAIGIWLIVAMVFCAWLLAGITLRPVRRDMERQRRFMANISHELRTPLSVMRISTEAALLDAGAAPTADELLEMKESTLEEIDRMTKIIEFLLNFSNIERRMNRLTFASVDLADIAKRAANFMADRAKRKSITLVVETEAATVSGNATAIEEVALNLVKNAIAYTPVGGSVWITVTKWYGSAVFSVRDNGIGIPPKDLPNIFEAFYRGESASAATHHEDGSFGLGLAIVKEIATLHGAKIAMRSEVGKGTTITLRFPGRFLRFFAPWA